MICYTETGSIYEIDNINKKIRRLSGQENPTPRIGQDGQWRKFKTIEKISNGQMLIIWDFEGLVAKSTLTSIVVRTEEDIAKA